VTRIERFASRTDAELARTVLEANGIPAYVSGDDAGGLHPEIPYGIGGTAVVVPDERYDEAIAVLDDEFGSGAAAAAELEAAALAAGRGDDAGDGPAVTGTPSSVPPTALDRERPHTRRSGRGRPAFVVVVGIMLAAVLLTALFLTVLEVWVW
jgi:hypothetical protein